VKRETIKKIVTELLKNLLEDWEIDFVEEIKPETSLVNDLGFGSVDIIQLCVLLEREFQRKFEFQKLLMKNTEFQQQCRRITC
jgi:acyl carrier protein